MAADELNTQETETQETTQTTTPEPAATEKAPAKAAEKATEPAKATEAKPAEKGKASILGTDSEEEVKAEEVKEEAKATERAVDVKAMREALAKHVSAGDKKLYDKELKRLERLGIEKPEQIYGLYRDLERWRDEGGLIKKPGKDAKPEDIAEFHKALGVPEKPEDYLKEVKLENGAVIGEADKPLLATFTEAAHKAGTPPQSVNALVNWYYQQQEQQMAAMEEADDKFWKESERALKDELGASFNRQKNALGALFAQAAGGANKENANSVFYRLLNGRTADGKPIGADPDVLRWMFSVNADVNPVASVVEGAGSNAMSIDNELAEIKKLRTTDSKRYWSDTVQARELELINAQQKARQRA